MEVLPWKNCWKKNIIPLAMSKFRITGGMMGLLVEYERYAIRGKVYGVSGQRNLWIDFLL